MHQLDQHEGSEIARSPEGHTVIACNTCGFAHLWPKPSAAELAKYYADSFYETHSPDDWFEKEKAEEPYWVIEHRDRLRNIAVFLRQPTGKLLDVGCGGGWLVAHAAACGWQALGVEPSKSMWARIKDQIPVELGVFPDVHLRGLEPFDAVHLKLVMEHLAEPLSFLQRIHDVLRPGGVVCVEVPNDFNRLQLAARERLNKAPWWIVYPVHVNYFSFDSLEGLLRRAGFEPVLREATYPMEWFLLQGVDYIGSDETGRDCHRKRMALEMNLEASGLGDIRRSFSRWLAGNGIGREAIVYATRQ